MMHVKEMSLSLFRRPVLTRRLDKSHEAEQTRHEGHCRALLRDRAGSHHC